MARLQTFPRDVEIVGTYADAQRQLGNAVPSLLGEVLAREISEQLLGRHVEGALKLTVKPALVPAPNPEQPKPLPRRFMALRGSYEPHPGTGKGFAALSRSPSVESGL